jgi:putative tryptophan/tyrosine transport system substrate-binding protein
MRRRDFITLLGGAAAARPLAARAQASKLPIIGLAIGSMPQNVPVDAFAQRLRELGWVDGRNVAIELRWAEGRAERLDEIAHEFVRLNVDVIVTAGTAGVLAAKRATSTIPIVFPIASDPIGAGLVESLARPGGNVTGLSLQQTELAGKRVELLREIVPNLRRLAVIANVSGAAPDPITEVREVSSAARAVGLDLVTLEIRRGEDILPAMQTMDARADALLVVGDPLLAANTVTINTLALAARMPTMNPVRAFVTDGGLMSYGPNFADLFRRAADYVDKILRGRKPADLPIEQPTKFDLIVNLATAKTIGLAIPESFLLRADEVIE